MAEDQQQDHSKFNVNNLLSFRNKEKDKVLNFGAYNGNVQMSFGPATFERGSRPRSATLTPALVYLVSEMMDDIIKKPEPGKKRSLVFHGIWNQEARKKELSLLVTIGMDDNAMCYIGIKHINQEKETFTGKYDLTGDMNAEVSGMYDDDKSRSMMTLKMLHHYLSGSVLTTGALLTRNHLRTPSFQQRGNNNGNNRGGYRPQSSGSNSAVTESLGDEF